MIEVVASATVSAPSRLASRRKAAEPAATPVTSEAPRWSRRVAPVAGIDLLTLGKERLSPTADDGSLSLDDDR